MKIAIAGSSGLVGTALCESLLADKHEVIRLARVEKAGKNEVAWDPAKGTVDAKQLEGCEAFINLAGDNIAKGRWNAIKKARMRSSRLDTTQTLVRAMQKLSTPPKVFVSASAIGYYGNRGADEMTEQHPAGSGFLADLCRDWEIATKPAVTAGIRTVNLRIGVVLSKKGGALEKMLTPFKLGLGGIVGNGKQYWSVVSLDELVSIIRFCVDTPGISGPVNAVSHAVTNEEFTKEFGSVIMRPTMFPLPAFAAKLALGEMANDLLLASTRVKPQQLVEHGYKFKHETLADAIKASLA